MLAAAAALIALASAIALWFLVHHVPGWYEPVYVPHARLDEVRGGAARRFGDFGDAVVKGRPFEFSLEERQVCEWIAARERIWPESSAWLPERVNDPMVRFRDGLIIVAARLDLDGRQFIAGAHLRVSVGDDEILVVHLDRITAGSMPVPVRLLASPVARLLRMDGRDPDLLPIPVADVVRYFRESEPLKALSDGVRRANRFIWENGRRPYRIDRIEVGEGKLTLGIEPL